TENTANTPSRRDLFGNATSSVKAFTAPPAWARHLRVTDSGRLDMDVIGSAQKVLTLVASSFAVWKALQEFRKTRLTQAVSPAAMPGEPTKATESSAGADLGLYAVALLVAAIATLSLSSAMLPRSDLALWSWSISIVIGVLFAAACVLPLNTT